ncbi:protein of unknown function [Taphrina deformans PYCC 5710]|uniref:Jacalin-type lectin domain-containing protein n=1 Tax=Taphrina deformans (strain PYCC 5710 / ATCC 11124 / CBS 356.35 / IMI 108563 / JCM 9778 / NBRC 8474) TaxID=1097556 RepID=R4XIA3_TAPDE|nr:protein of unknown function [Taphrina deformans PYCC 5710]|eukprot:CCG84229.1 protein of unknown function [Taphrina deformans PYCC 5710]
MDEKDLPPYSGPTDHSLPSSSSSSWEKKEEKVQMEITLLHSPVVGTGEGTDLLGHRSGSPHDFRVPVGCAIAAVTIHSGLWIDAIGYVLTDGSGSGSFGGQGGSASRVQGNVVGFSGRSGGPGVLRQLSVVTCPDRRAFETFYRETKEAGAVRADTRVLQRSSDPTQPGARPGEHGKGKSRFKWDTARLTGGRGLGLRWNHERHRVEIYQG